MSVLSFFLLVYTRNEPWSPLPYCYAKTQRDKLGNTASIDYTFKYAQLRLFY